MKLFKIQKSYNKAHCRVLKLTEDLELSDESSFVKGGMLGVYNGGRLSYTAKVSKVNGDEIWIPARDFLGDGEAISAEIDHTSQPTWPEKAPIRLQEPQSPPPPSQPIPQAPPPLYAAPVASEEAPARYIRNLTADLAAKIHLESNNLVAKAFESTNPDLVFKIANMVRDVDGALSRVALKQ